jgi:hypothetical protein
MPGRDWLDYVTLAIAIASMAVALAALAAGYSDRRRKVGVSLEIAYEADAQGRLLEPPAPAAFLNIVNKSRRPIEILGMGFQGTRQPIVQVLIARGLPRLLADAESWRIGVDPVSVAQASDAAGPLLRPFVFDSAGRRYYGRRIGRDAFAAWLAAVRTEPAQ